MLASELFGVAAETAQPLAGEHDRNVALDGPQGRRVLKLSPPGRAGLAAQDAALAHLEAHDPGVAVPRLLGLREREGGGVARLLSWIDGTPWGEAGSIGRETLTDLGRAVARVDRALAGLRHEAIARPLDWNLVEAGALTPDAVRIADRGRRAAVEGVLAGFIAGVLPRLAALPAQAIHNDANEHNVLLDGAGSVAGLIDFGDVCVAPRVCGLAVACAYAAADGPRQLRAAADVVAGYHEVAPLHADELALLFDLLRLRLAMSVCLADRQARAQPDNAYLLVSQDGVWPLLRALAADSGEQAHARFRAACGYEPVPSARAVRAWLATAETGPVVRAPLHDAPVLDWSAGGEPPAQPAIGRYLERRDVYRGDAFVGGEPGERRTLHLGVDVFLPAGTEVLAPLDGVVHASAFRPAACDWGGIVVLEHATDGGVRFFTLYGHLEAAASGLAPGTPIARGAPVGRLGAEAENGGWAPHLHLQLLTTTFGLADDVPGVAAPSERELWTSASPDPNLLLGLPGGDRAPQARGRAALLRARRRSLSRALSLSYAEPLQIVRGEGAYLYDADGRGFVDLVNNVCHVGHAHPRVVAAAADQMERLNTNTRYLHDGLVEYARRLAETLPDPLSVVFLTNSGSEANDLALRLALSHTGRREVLVLDHAYHGNLSSLIDISPYKFDGRGGAGRPEHVRVATLADPYRGAHGAHAGGYLADLDRALAGFAPGAFIAESMPGVAGQIVFPTGYLAGAFTRARAAGAVCIADEVQVGFGRVGDAFWGFELQDVLPDVVTLGKPIGNGHPLGAVVTTPEIAASFAGGMEYFNTFGGNPVSCAAGLAVLDVIADERLQAHARRLGGRLLGELRTLGARHAAIGDVRGRGLFIGIELSGPDGAPDAATAAAVVEHARGAGVLLSTDGPDRNVLKLKPPLALDDAGAERCVEVLDAALDRVAQPAAVER